MIRIKVWAFFNLAYAIFSGNKPSAQEALEGSPCASCMYLRSSDLMPPQCDECEVIFSNWTPKEGAN